MNLIRSLSFLLNLVVLYGSVYLVSMGIAIIDCEGLSKVCTYTIMTSNALKTLLILILFLLFPLDAVNRVLIQRGKERKEMKHSEIEERSLAILIQLLNDPLKLTNSPIMNLMSTSNEGVDQRLESNGRSNNWEEEQVYPHLVSGYIWITSVLLLEKWSRKGEERRMQKLIREYGGERWGTNERQEELIRNPGGIVVHHKKGIKEREHVQHAAQHVNSHYPKYCCYHCWPRIKQLKYMVFEWNNK